MDCVIEEACERVEAKNLLCARKNIVKLDCSESSPIFDIIFVRTWKGAEDQESYVPLRMIISTQYLKENTKEGLWVSEFNAKNVLYIGGHFKAAWRRRER